MVASLLLLAALDVFGGLGTRLAERMDREEAWQDREPADERSPT